MKVGMMGLGPFACATVTLAACGPTQEEEQAAAESAAAYYLIDPSSAQFRDVEFRSPDIVCGQVNGKNRMGAYSGFENFVAYRDENGEWRANLVLGDPYSDDQYRRDCIGEQQAQADLDEAGPHPDREIVGIEGYGAEESEPPTSQDTVPPRER